MFQTFYFYTSKYIFLAYSPNKNLKRKPKFDIKLSTIIIKKSRFKYIKKIELI